MAHYNLTRFGDIIEKVKFDNVFQWFLKFQDPVELWKANPTFLIVQTSYIIGAITTFFHAANAGGRWLWLWFGAICVGLVTEALSYFVPDIDNFWHHSSPITFLGDRLPLYIVIVYPVFYYHAIHAVHTWGLRNWVAPLASGLVVVLVDIPYDIIGIKFLYWTWHDTDPNIADRFYWVPWNSFYFHTVFNASFLFFFHFFKKVFCPKTTNQWQCSNSFAKELMTTILAAIMGFVGGVILFIPIYHPLHDLFNIHSEVTFFILFSIILALVLSQIKYLVDTKAEKSRNSCWNYALLAHLVLHYGTFLGIAIWGQPQDIVSIGLHEPIGPCNVMQDVHTPFGMVIQKRKYLCVEDYSEDYFDFGCLPKGKQPSGGIFEFYTICGTPMENRAEYITLLSLITVVAAILFSTFYCNKSEKKNNAAVSKQKNLSKKMK